jgi:hypothetical protein
MTISAEHHSDGLLALPPLLNTESQDQFASLYAELEQDIQPTGVVERIYVFDIANIVWEILRLRRYKIAIINTSRLAALQGILEQLLCPGDYEHSYEKDRDAEDLARSWFSSKKAQARVAKVLRGSQMDEGAIEAEAFRLCLEHIERLDRMLALQEVRRDKALRCIADYRQTFAKQIELSTDRILKNDDVPVLIARRQAT